MYVLCVSMRWFIEVQGFFFIFWEVFQLLHKISLCKMVGNVQMS